MKISVVTPSYNQLRWLKLCVASVADQQGTPFEHIIQDANTGPELTEWVRDHSDAKLFLESDSGMYDAINRGFQKATGDIVAWLNCDEQYLPGALSKVAAFFEAHPKVDVLFGDAVLIGEQGKLLSYRRAILPSLAHIKLAHLNTLSCAMFVRRSVIDRGLLLDTQWKAIADAVWVAGLIQAKLKMAILPEALSAFTITETNLGQSSLAFKEGERWQQQTTRRWYRALQGPVIAWHRVRKFWHGAYAHRSFATEIYTAASPTQRVPVSSENLSFAWKNSEKEEEKNRFIAPLLETISKLFRLGSHARGSATRSLPFAFYQPTHLPFIYTLAVPILLTFIILYLEQETSTAIIVAPMLSTIMMLLLSFRLEPRQLIPFAVAFAGAIYVSIHYMQPFDPCSMIDWTRMGLRLSTFLIASILAGLFSKSRCEAKARQDQTLAIITSMPTPVVISDALGSILFANDEAVDYLKLPRGELIGASYPKLLMMNQEEGAAMRDYIRFFQDIPETNGASLARNRGVCLTRQDHGAMHPLEARFICMGQGEARYMVTVLKG